MNKFALVAAAALAATTFGVAGALAQAGSTDSFDTADANNDGSVSFEEAMGVFPTLTQQLFDQADADHSGALDETEFGSLQGLTAGLNDNGTASSSSSSAASSAASSGESSSSQSSTNP